MSRRQVESFDLVINPRTNKCRGERAGVPITGWCKDAMAVLDRVRAKEG